MRPDAPLTRGHGKAHVIQFAIHLPTWHRVYMNTEHGGRAMRHVAFLD